MIHRRLLQLAGAVPGAVLALATLGLVISALHLAFALAAGQLITGLIRGGADPIPSLIVLGAVIVARAAVIFARETAAARIGVSVRLRLRVRLLDALAAAPAAGRESGSAAATVIDGVDGLDAYYTRYLPQLLVALIVPAAVVVIVSVLLPSAGLVLGIAAAIAVLAPRAWDALLLRNGRRRWERFTRLSADYVEALQQIPLLRSFGAGKRIEASLGARADGLRDSTMAQLRVSLVETALSTAAVQLGVVLAVIAALVAAGMDSSAAAGAVTVLLLTRECFRPVQELGAHWHAGYLGLTAVDGLDQLLSQRAGVPEDGALADPVTESSLELSGVTYRYPASSVGVTELSLSVAAGETVAVLGASGSGKSTVARLLEREIEPDQGGIRLGGIELGEFTRSALSRSVVVVPQDPVLFTWTVRENLRLYRPDASDAELEYAATTAQIHDVLLDLPDGYDTVLSENGEQLSGGQRQRVAIARALVARSGVLVLDEVTSALDLDTERRVMDAIAADPLPRTTVIVAHRPTACAHATRWIGLAGGRVAASGDGRPSMRSGTEAPR